MGWPMFVGRAARSNRQRMRVRVPCPVPITLVSVICNQLLLPPLSNICSLASLAFATNTPAAAAC